MRTMGKNGDFFVQMLAKNRFSYWVFKNISIILIILFALIKYTYYFVYLKYLLHFIVYYFFLFSS